MIQVNNLVKNFEDTRALDGLDLFAPKGAVYGLVGPNGAGKSTLIRHLTGIYQQDAGKILIGGEPVFNNPTVKLKIAYIPDEIPFWSQATIEDMRRFCERKDHDAPSFQGGAKACRVQTCFGSTPGDRNSG